MHLHKHANWQPLRLLLVWEPCLNTALAITGINGTVLSATLVSVQAVPVAKGQLSCNHVYNNVHGMLIFLSTHLVQITTGLCSCASSLLYLTCVHCIQGGC